MESFFATVPETRWPKPAGRLHVYALPGDDVAEQAVAYQDALAGRGIAGLARQPREWLHMTIEVMNHYLDDLTADQVTVLTAGLRRHVSRVPACGLQVGPAVVSAHSITLDAVPDRPWRALRAAVRDAAVEALGPGAVRPLTGPGRPHITTHYAVGHVDIEPHLGVLNNLRLGRATCPIRAVHLVAVTQHIDAGVYTWDYVAELPLGAAETRS